MYRSGGYVLMVVATLVGIVALLWPTPQERKVVEIAAVPVEAPRAETPKPPKSAAKTPANKGAAKAAAAPTPAPPAIVKKMPAPNTTTRRAGPQIQNGMQPNPFGGLNNDGSGKHEAPARPGLTARPNTAKPPPAAAEHPHQEPVRP